MGWLNLGAKVIQNVGKTTKGIGSAVKEAGIKIDVIRGGARGKIDKAVKTGTGVWNKSGRSVANNASPVGAGGVTKEQLAAQATTRQFYNTIEANKLVAEAIKNGQKIITTTPDLAPYVKQAWKKVGADGTVNVIEEAAKAALKPNLLQKLLNASGKFKLPGGKTGLSAAALLGLGALPLIIKNPQQPFNPDFDIEEEIENDNRIKRELPQEFQNDNDNESNDNDDYEDLVIDRRERELYRRRERDNSPEPGFELPPYPENNLPPLKLKIPKKRKNPNKQQRLINQGGVNLVKPTYDLTKQVNSKVDNLNKNISRLNDSVELLNKKSDKIQQGVLLTPGTTAALSLLTNAHTTVSQQAVLNGIQMILNQKMSTQIALPHKATMAAVLPKNISTAAVLPKNMTMAAVLPSRIVAAVSPADNYDDSEDKEFILDMFLEINKKLKNIQDTKCKPEPKKKNNEHDCCEEIIKGNYELGCKDENGNKKKFSYNGKAFKGLSKQIDIAIKAIDMAINHLCEKQEGDSYGYPVLPHSGLYETLPVGSEQLVLTFADSQNNNNSRWHINLPLPKPMESYSWNDFKFLNFTKGSCYGRIFWKNSKMPTGSWFINEQSAKLFLEKLIDLTTAIPDGDELTKDFVRITKNGRRKKAITTRSVKCIRAAFCRIDAEGEPVTVKVWKE